MPVEKGSLVAEIAEKRSRRARIIEEIDVANTEIQVHNKAVGEIQVRLKGLLEENTKTTASVATLIELNGEDPEPPIVSSAPKREITPIVLETTEG